MATDQRILLLGCTGQVGWELRRALAPLADLTAVDYPEVDFRHPASLGELVAQVQPDIIVNAVAYTNVDRAEHESEASRLINADSPGELARLAHDRGALLVHYSTDYVFDGRKGSPYTEPDPPNPLNTYGLSKLEGERSIQAVDHPHLILRTSWVYSFRRPSFASKVRDWARSRETVRVVVDQLGSPTWCRALAETTALLLARLGKDPLAAVDDKSGVYHLAGNGSASRYEFARALLAFDPEAELHRVRALEEARTAEFPSPAERPTNTALDCSKFEEAFSLRLPDWREALRMALGAD
jgi:dTDP-4-dehydrorhamnose reductase